MAINLNKRVWVLAERLYIHSNKAPKFINLLQSLNIEYSPELYLTFDTTSGLYTFMSEENYEFADFMVTVPSYKYLSLLEKIIFDPEVLKNRRDNWNYYGEFIRNWYPALLDLLKLAGVQIDATNHKLSYEEPDLPEGSEDFLSYTFLDPFLDYIRKEANECFKNRQYLAVMFLSRKILESIIVRLCEVVFPKIVGRQYNEQNHDLWYDKGRGKYHNLETLLENLKDHSNDFHEDKALLIELLSLIKPLKDATNECVHNDYKIPDVQYINSWNIPVVIGMSRKLFRKYCNP